MRVEGADRETGLTDKTECSRQRDKDGKTRAESVGDGAAGREEERRKGGRKETTNPTARQFQLQGLWSRVQVWGLGLRILG